MSLTVLLQIFTPSHLLLILTLDFSGHTLTACIQHPYPQNVLAVAPFSCMPKKKTVPDQPSQDLVMQALFPLLLQPRAIPPEFQKHLMTDAVGCKPHTASASVGATRCVGNADSALYVEGALMMQGNFNW